MDVVGTSLHLLFSERFTIEKQFLVQFSRSLKEFSLVCIYNVDIFCSFSDVDLSDSDTCCIRCLLQFCFKFLSGSLFLQKLHK